MKHCVPIVIFIHLFFLFHPSSAQRHPTDKRADYLDHLFSCAVLFDTADRHNEQNISTVDPDDAWRQWRTVGNYFYGKDRGSLPMIADLNALHPYFRDKIVRLISRCKAAGIELAVVESYRTHSKQAQYYAMGNGYTSTPGGKSRHQYGLAVDVVPIVDSVAVWDSHRLWRKIGAFGERLGLTWGGRWRVLYDPGHFEWSGGVTRQQLAEGHFPRIPESMSDAYQSMETELGRLRKYWEAWETEQGMIANSHLSGRRGKEEIVGAGN